MGRYKLLIKNLRQVVQVCSNNEALMCGENQQQIVITDASCVAVNNDGNIFGIGGNDCFNDEDFEQVIDGSGCCLLPGLIDAHTHPVWAGDRVNEFSMKLAGCSYMQIHQAGGGIYFTVEHTKNASEDELYQSFVERLHNMIKHGTTLVECKSGYGLDLETELKMLRVIERARNDKNIKIDISSTYCGAHAVPKGKTAEEATYDIINEQIPRIKDEIEAGRLHVDNIDVFCEKGVYDCSQTRRILEAGRKIGLNINFHGDELHQTGSAELGAEMKAHAVSHLEEISKEGIKEMAKSQTVAVILPTTAYILRLPHPPVRSMIQAGVPVALGSDFNPNAYCLSMPTTMHMACVLLGMNLNEALVASTINAAAALGKSSTHGSIEVDKRANLLLVQAERWEHLVYRLSSHDEVVKMVICGGDISYSKIK